MCEEYTVGVNVSIYAAFYKCAFITFIKLAFVINSGSVVSM
nr:MAG TPA: hypothetical protein [Caudoviricetes sp.]